MHEEQSLTIGNMQYAALARPCFGERVSGDVAVVQSDQASLFVAIVDVLGHGPAANALAVDIRDYLEAEWRPDVMNTLLGLHGHLKGSLGAAASLAVIDQKTGEVRHVGIGNTVLRRFGKNPIRLLSVSGIVGANIRKPKEQRLYLGPRDVLIGYSDGISDRFELADYPQLVYENTRTIVRRVVRQFGKQFDDATCFALRYDA